MAEQGVSRIRQMPSSLRPREFRSEMDFAYPSRIFVACQKGLADYLNSELQEMGYSPQVHAAGVSLHGSLLDCLRMNLQLRCASQVLYSLQQFPCLNPDQLYRSVRQIPWEKILPDDGYFSVQSHVSTPSIRSGMFANVRVKDAIVDRIRQVSGKRPDCGPELHGAVIFLHWRESMAEVYLDTSGESISKHGYRAKPGKAPMNEALASAAIMATRWTRDMPFVNPMCGSGTLAIEAALMATNRKPGLFRKNFAFQHLLGYEHSEFEKRQNELRQLIRKSPNQMIFASDVEQSAVDIARFNAQRADVFDQIRFDVCDFRSTPLPETQPFVVFFNPEYGERLGETDELASVYSDIGDFFKQRCPNSWGYVFTGNLELGKQIGLRTKRRIPFQSSNFECRLLEYELYSGTKKVRPPAPPNVPTPLAPEKS